MAKKKYLQDNDGQIWPITTADCVYLSDGSKTIKKYIDDGLAGKAASSHGTHLTIGTGSGNAAAGNHTHNYAGSSSAGGAATSANKVNTNLVIKLNSGSTEGTNLFTFNGSAAKTINITPSAIGAAAASHGTHLTIGTGASNAAAGNHTHSYLPLTGGTLSGSLYPSGTNTLSLGSSSKKWKELYTYPVSLTTDSNGYTAIIKSNHPNWRISNSEDKNLAFSGTYNCFHPELNNAILLGNTNYRWSHIYSQNALNASSDRILKENIKYINKENSKFSYVDMYNFVKDDLELATYNFIGDDEEKINFIAQDILVNADGSDNKVGQMIVKPIPVPTEEEINKVKSELGDGQEYQYPTLTYDSGAYASVTAGALKQAINKIEELENRIVELESKF